MPQVPYNPVPREDLTGGAIPRVGVSTPEAAFGGNVARAVEHLGGTMESTGNELFARAVEMKKLQAETNVNSAASQYIVGQGEKLDDFQALRRGNASREALQDFNRDHEQSRLAIRNGLRSDYEKKLFDAQTMGTFRAITIGAAKHAGAEQRAYGVDAAKSSLEAIEQEIQKSPWDNNLWNDKQPEIERLVRGVVSAEGGSEDEVQNMLGKHRSRMIAARAQGMSREDAGKAMNFYKANEYNMLDQDRNRVFPGIQNRLSGVVEREVATNLTMPQFREGPQLWAWATPNDRKLVEDLPEYTTRALRQLAIDHPELRFQLTSGRRTPEKNLAVGGVPQSQHLLGNAVDWVPKGDFGQAAQWLEEAAQKAGVPIMTIVEKDHIHTMIPRNVDPKTIPPPSPESKESIKARGIAEATGQDPTNQNLGYRTGFRIDAAQRAQDALIREGHRRDIQTVGDYINKFKVKDPDQMLNGPPEISEVWNRLPADKRMAFERKIYRVDDRVSDPKEVHKAFVAWVGDQNDPDSVNKFLDMDFYSNDKLSNADQEKFAKKQVEIRNESPTTTRRLQHALSLFRYEPGFREFYGKKEGQPGGDDWNEFAFTLGGILDQHYADHHKSMTDTEILKVGNRLILDTTLKFMEHPIDYFFGTPKPGEHPALTKMKPEAAEIDQMKRESEAAGKPLTDAAALKAWRFMKYQELFGK